MTGHTKGNPRMEVVMSRSLLRDEFEDQARRRREKADEYPQDERNLVAAEIFDKLAATADAIPDDVLAAYFELEQDNDDPFRDSERHSEMLREIGFHSAYDTAEEFVRAYIADRTVFSRG